MSSNKEIKDQHLLDKKTPKRKYSSYKTIGIVGIILFIILMVGLLNSIK